MSKLSRRTFIRAGMGATAANAFTLSIGVPANTTAAVFVPAPSAGHVTESGIAAASRTAVRFLRCEDGQAVYEVQSSTWLFQASL